jgi:hypothetical protein
MGWDRGHAGSPGRWAAARRGRRLRRPVSTDVRDRPLSVKSWLAVGVSVVAAAAVTAGLIGAVTGSGPWPFGHHQQAAGPQARRYLNASACLLTDPSGIAPGTPGAPVWKAMQTASLATHVMVSYLPDTGPADAAIMLSTLMERQCGVIITTGTPAAKVMKAAKADRRQSFVLVAASGTVGSAETSNTIIVSPTGAPARIDQAIRALASQARTSGS